MKNKYSREVKIGLFVLATIAMVIWGISFLKGKNIFSSQRTFYAIYNDVTGLSSKANVTINGFKVGFVETVELIPSSRGSFLVKISVTEKELFIPEDSQLELVPAAFIGAARIDLILGNSATSATPSDTLTALSGGGLMATLGKELSPAIEKIKGTLTHIDSVLIPIKNVLNDSTTSSLAIALQRLPQIMKNVEDLTGNLKNATAGDRLGKIIANVESITGNLKNNNDKIQNILTNFSSISDSLNKANIKKIVDNAGNAVAKVDSLMGKINRGEGTIGALLSDDKLYNQLDSAAVNLDNLLWDIKANPFRYLNFSLIKVNKYKNKSDNPEKQKKK